MIALSREYPCAFGGPVLSRADPAIFRLRYFTRCMECRFCRDACCDHGVDIDLGNAARLKALPKEFHDLVGAPTESWFVGPAVQDEEFPEGAYVRTAVRDGACIFRNRSGRGCMVHAYCQEKGLDYHRLKPMVSTLFPLTFEQGALTAACEAKDGSLVCGGEGPSLYQGAREEVAYYFGKELVCELDEWNVKWSKSQASPM